MNSFLFLPWIKTHQVQLSLVPLSDTALPVCKFSFKLAARVFLSTLSQLQLLSLFSAQLIGLCQPNWNFCQELWFYECPEVADIVLNIRAFLDMGATGKAKLCSLTSQIALDNSAKAEAVKD